MAHRFSDFGIKAQTKAFSGTKLGIDYILNTTVIVEDFKVVPSTQNTGECLHLQLQINEQKHVCFTGSKNLIDMIKKPEVKLPFETVIKKEDRTFFFT